MINRTDFVKICQNAIEKTRDEITVVNQLSGYRQYQYEIKENQYLEKIRVYAIVNILANPTFSNASRLTAIHDLVKYTQIGRCDELAEYLGLEILENLSNINCEARLDIIGSKEFRHKFLHIHILLKNEKSVSLWEIDAWDPRIIDRSSRPDGSIKNKEVLCYGYSPGIVYSVNTFELQKQSYLPYFASILRTPIKGHAKRSPSPEKEIFSRESNRCYPDFSIYHSYGNGKLGKSHGKAGWIQKVSVWQKEEPSPLDSEESNNSHKKKKHFHAAHENRPDLDYRNYNYSLASYSSSRS